jgi:hypothetical protein
MVAVSMSQKDFRDFAGTNAAGALDLELCDTVQDKDCVSGIVVAIKSNRASLLHRHHTIKARRESAASAMRVTLLDGCQHLVSNPLPQQM